MNRKIGRNRKDEEENKCTNPQRSGKMEGPGGGRFRKAGLGTRHAWTGGYMPPPPPPSVWLCTVGGVGCGVWGSMLTTKADNTHCSRQYALQHAIRTAACNTHCSMQYALQQTIRQYTLQHVIHTAADNTHCSMQYTLQHAIHAAACNTTKGKRRDCGMPSLRTLVPLSNLPWCGRCVDGRQPHAATSGQNHQHQQQHQQQHISTYHSSIDDC